MAHQKVCLDSMMSARRRSRHRRRRCLYLLDKGRRGGPSSHQIRLAAHANIVHDRSKSMYFLFNHPYALAGGTQFKYLLLPRCGILLTALSKSIVPLGLLSTQP